jgi:hypothetical protein
MKKYIDTFSKDMRQHIYIWALGFAIVLNLDRILLGQWALLPITDTFDGPFQAAYIFAQNILKYGVISQSPEQVCGFSNLASSVPPVYIALMMVLPLYQSFLFLSLLAAFVAFLGMFLLLHDEFKLDQTASIVGALSFCSIAIPVWLGLSGVGIPLLICCFERIFEITSSFKKRLLSYLYILLYFGTSIFPIISLSLLFFYIFYYIFISNIKKTPRNILTISLIWCLFGLINLPAIMELITYLPTSHRVTWTIMGASQLGKTWGYAAITFMERLLSIKSVMGVMSAPSLLGTFIILFYFISIKSSDKDKLFYFPIFAVLFIEFYAFFLYNSPIFEILIPFLGLFKSANLDRLYYLLLTLFSILIAQASQHIISYNCVFSKNSWHLTVVSFVLYVVFVVAFNHNYYWQFIVQSLSLAIFLLLLYINYIKNNQYSIGNILIISFLFFCLANTLTDKLTIENIYNFQHRNKSPQIELIKHMEGNNLEFFRVVTLKQEGHQSQLLLNGFKCADGYVAVYPLAYKEYWAKVIEPEIKQSPIYTKGFLGSGSKVFLLDDSTAHQPLRRLNFNQNLLRLINVKYIFSGEKILDCEKYGLIEVAEVSRAYINAPKWKKYFRPWEYYVYKNKDFASPAFLTDAVRFFDGKDELLDELGKRDYAYLSTHTFALRGAATILESTGLDLAHSEILDIQLKPDQMTVRLRNRYPVILNLTTNYSRNWICEIDGRKAPIFNTYNAFMSVLVPPDSHLLIIEYHNTLLSYAYWVSIIGFVIINTYVVISLRGLGK